MFSVVSVFFGSIRCGLVSFDFSKGECVVFVCLLRRAIGNARARSARLCGRGCLMLFFFFFFLGCRILLEMRFIVVILVNIEITCP